MVTTIITCYQEQQSGDNNYNMLPRATKWRTIITCYQQLYTCYQQQQNGDNNYKHQEQQMTTIITCYQEQQSGDDNYNMLPRATKW